MGTGIKIVLIAIMPFLIIYTVFGNIWTKQKQENVLIKISTVVEEIGTSSNFWLDFTNIVEKYNNALYKIQNPSGNFFEKVGDILNGIWEIIMLPVDVLFKILMAIIEPIIIIFRFLNQEIITN